MSPMSSEETGATAPTPEPFAGINPRLAALMQQPTSQLISVEESAYLEFKSSARWNLEKRDRDASIETTIVKTVAGFMNARGGVLLIGVNDAGEPVGLDRDYKTLGRARAPRDIFENWLTTRLSRSIGEVSVGTCTAILFDQIEGYDVCRIEVLPSSEPVFMESKEGTRFLVRLNNATHEFDVRRTHEYIRRRWPGPGLPTPQPGVQTPQTVPAARPTTEQPSLDRSSMPATLPTPGGERRTVVPQPATPAPSLERQFHEAMVEIYKRAKKEAGYTATRFIQMVSGDGGVATARKLLRSAAPSDGFSELWKRGRLDLSVENYILRPEFEPLFSEEDRTIALERLKYHGFKARR